MIIQWAFCTDSWFYSCFLTLGYTELTKYSKCGWIQLTRRNHIICDARMILNYRHTHPRMELTITLLLHRFFKLKNRFIGVIIPFFESHIQLHQRFFLVFLNQHCQSCYLPNFTSAVTTPVGKFLSVFFFSFIF